MEVHVERGGDPHPALLSRPELHPHLRWVWSAFWDLNRERQLGYGVSGPVPFFAIRRYAVEVAGITDPDEFDHFKGLIIDMDDAYHSHMRPKRGKKPAAEVPQAAGEEPDDSSVSIHDVDGVKNVMARLKARWR
jgi:hypothetical protein